jgi:hypothetical protein
MQSTGKCLKSNKVFTTQCLIALKIKDRTWDSQSKFQLLEYQTFLLNSMFKCLYFREKGLWLGGGKMVECGGGGTMGAGGLWPPSYIVKKCPEIS